MKQTMQIKMTTFLVCSVFAGSLTGCDMINNLISPQKKQVKKIETPVVVPTAAAPEVMAKPAVPADQGPLPANMIARVGSWTLTDEQFNQRLKLLKEGLPDFDANKPGAKTSVLNELIRQELLVKDAESSGVGQQKEIVDAIEDFRRTLLVQELANRLTKETSATEKDAQDYYDKNKDLFIEPTNWKVREIVVADEATAKNILVQVLQGGDFAAIATAQSKGKTAANGGALPAFVKAPFAAMQTAVSTLDNGGVSAVFKGPEGFYIVKVDEKKGGEMKQFADVKKDLVSGLTLRKQQQAVLDYIEKLAAKTKVEVNKDLLGDTQKQ